MDELFRALQPHLVELAVAIFAAVVAWARMQLQRSAAVQIVQAVDDRSERLANQGQGKLAGEEKKALAVAMVGENVHPLVKPLGRHGKSKMIERAVRKVRSR